MNGLMGSYREISMDEEDDGTRDEDMHADTEEEVSNLSNDSNEDEEVTESEENRRPNSLDLVKTQSMTSSDCTRSISSLSSAVIDDKSVQGALSELPGTVTKDGDMVMFVAENLHEKIKMGSPLSKREAPGLSTSSTPSLYKQALTPSIPPIDPSVISNLEIQARSIAINLDNMLENLTGTLHSMSSITVDCTDAYRDCVCKTCDATDISIKSMYQLMAKCEELGNTMRPMYRLADQIKEIKRLLDLFEGIVG
uniref:BLOC-1-related complex subunit 6 C-terminal helix domain-containing protein n=1 Tax=Strigamia maritima TaxID=126957 RepID=T1JJ96_STRMM